jgi:hypothetical protein
MLYFQFVEDGYKIVAVFNKLKKQNGDRLQQTKNTK